MELQDLKGYHFEVDNFENELRYIERLLKTITGCTVRAEYSREWSHKHSGMIPDRSRAYNDYLIEYTTGDGVVNQLMYLRGNNGKYIVITGIRTRKKV